MAKLVAENDRPSVCGMRCWVHTEMEVAMRKQSMQLWMTLLVFLLRATPLCGAQRVTVQVPDGVAYDNQHARYPLLVCRDVTDFPLSGAAFDRESQGSAEMGEPIKPEVVRERYEIYNSNNGYGRYNI